ncbi:hypothetical protein BaRGS_00010065, partial [Batillaria attramentaria]
MSPPTRRLASSSPCPTTRNDNPAKSHLLGLALHTGGVCSEAGVDTVDCSKMTLYLHMVEGPNCFSKPG